MYLVHAELRSEAGAALPAHTDRLIAEAAHPGEGIEHVVVHEDVGFGSLVGLFVLAATVEDAERTAASVCGRVVRTQPELAGFQLRRCSARMVPGYYDRQISGPRDGRDMPRHD
ncbi:hypothetical protein AB0N09_38420 [Streptomyces erythrochromogenes]|uniref:hypothetical protein n=1 Tax=Streptomyces erythrochromogenes TaxID=285574 RepID=UPI003421D962